MAAYSKDDYFVGSDLSDFSDFEDNLDTIELTENAENNGDEDKLCICAQIGTMDMIFCDEPSCKIQWFHYECVALTKATIPRGKWFCADCKKGTTTSTTPTGRQAEKTNKKKEKDTVGNKKKRQKPKAKVLRPPSSFGKEMAATKAFEFTVLTLQEIPRQSIYQLQFPNILESKIIISLILQHKDNVAFECFCKETIEKLWNCLNIGKSKFLSADADNAMWRSFHLVKTSMVDSWNDLLTELNIQFSSAPANILLHELLLELMKKLICESNRIDKINDDSTPSSLFLTSDEEEILRYVAGYIPHALLKRYKKLLENATAIAFASELSMWKEQEENDAPSFYTYTKSWIEKQNRGGLFKVNDKVFLLFREMEVEFQKHVSGKTLQELRGVNINNLLLGKLNNNKKVDRCWCAVVNCRLTEKLSVDLQQKVFMYWIKIRTKAFIKVYLDLKKKKDITISQRGEKALRKTISS